MKEVEVAKVGPDTVCLKVRGHILDCKLDCFGRVETNPKIREEGRKGAGIPLPLRVVNEIKKVVHEKLEGGWSKITHRTPSRKKPASNQSNLPFRSNIKPRH